MTLPKRMVHFGILALVAVSTLFGARGLPSIVLCLGNDGHFEFEYSNNGKCGQSTQPARAFDVSFSGEESHCGACTDVFIVGSSKDSIRPASGFVSGQIQMPASGAWSHSFHLDHATVGHLPQPPPFAIPHLVHLRTIRLLV